MIYNSLVQNKSLLETGAMFDFDMTLAEATEILEYLDEEFVLGESVADNTINQAIEKLQRLLTRVKSGDISEEDFKSGLDDVYDMLKAGGSAKKDGSAGGKFLKLLALLSALAGAVAVAVGDQEENYKLFFGGIIGSLTSLVMLAMGAKMDDGAKVNDKFYNALVEIESKYMMIKRKAKKSGDKKVEAQADKLIESIEEFKTKRRGEYYVVKNESTEVVNESDKSEIKINNFRQASDELMRTLNNAFDRFKTCCDVIEKAISKGLAMTPDTEKADVNEILDFQDLCNKKFTEKECMCYSLSGSLLTRWSKTFAAKYSPYGMEVRDKLEEKIANFTDDWIIYFDKFYDDLNEKVELKDKGINDIAKVFYDKLRHNVSVDVADRVFSVIKAWWENGVMYYYKFLAYEVSWARSVLKTAKIKKSLRFKILSKFVK